MQGSFVDDTDGERWYRIWDFFLAWSSIIAEQGNASCFQIVMNKNLDHYDRTRWVQKKQVVLGDRLGRIAPPNDHVSPMGTRPAAEA